MSSYNPQAHPNHPHAALPHRHAPPYNPAAALQPSGAPAGTFLPGTKVQVGNHRVVVEKYLSEGGFAHVYVVRLPHPVDGSETAVLKRVAVPDKAALANMRTEVETMKKLKGHRHIVKYIDSHASQLKGGGYEVFLLMEFCSGGGLIDFMNTRLQNRLTEPEILKIFTDVAEGVACMHYLKPPLLHRDLKVENVLISLSGNSVSYKLCDFGSAAPPRPPAQSAAEGRLIEDDVQRHTTLQYRSPEMIDVYRKQPIDEKSDIWALGVLLYKLCYYTTPFEEVGQMAILNASFKYPAYPPFSDRLKLLIGAMLRENPEKRPNIYEVLREACHMRGKECPIRDIYAGRSVSEARRYQELPPSPTEPPKVGAVFSPPIQETQIIPEIAPMRRGRPSKPVSQPNSAKPSPSPFRGVSNDPFAALDGSKANVESDELSSRFPTLDQFSILHEKGGKFDFEPTVVETKPDADDLSQRITNALADEAFAKRASPSAALKEPAGNRQPDDSPERKQKETQAPGLHEEPVRQQQPPLYQPVPQKPTMVSTGTMTSPSPPPASSETKSSSSRPIYRFPPSGHEHRPSSQPWATESERIPTGQGSIPSQTTPIFKHEPRPKPSSEKIAHLPVSSRPSLEASRPSNLDLDDPVARSKSANSKARPASVFVTSKVDHVRDPGSTRSSFESSRVQYEDGAPLQHSRTDTDRDYDRANIASDIDYLRAKEEETNKKREKRMSGGPKHTKRSSLSSLSLSGTKTLLAGRFGDAFRRFEHNTHHENKSSRSPSPDDAHKRLTPITGSEVTDLSDDGRGGNDNEDDISPEMRRELERRRLSQEEKRVANAAAEYRRRLAERGEGNRGPEIPKAPAIQNKVQSLLQENNKPPPKTATGYGRFTDSNVALQAKQFESRSEQQYTASVVSRDTGPGYGEEDRPKLPPRNNNNKELPGAPGGLLKQQTASGTLPPAVQRTGQQRPTAPPKPSNLRTGGQSETSAMSGHGHSLPGTPTSPSEDWEASFSRRYPSLSGLELVETEIEIPRISSIRTKEV